MGVGGLDSLGLFGHMIVEVARFADVLHPVGETEHIEIIAHRVLADEDNLLTLGVKAESISIGRETLNGDSLEGIEAIGFGTFHRLHAYNGQERRVFLGAGKHQNLVEGKRNRYWTENVFQVVTADGHIGGKTADALHGGAIALQQVDSTINTVNHHKHPLFGQIASMIGYKIHAIGGKVHRADAIGIGGGHHLTGSRSGTSVVTPLCLNTADQQQ